MSESALEGINQTLKEILAHLKSQQRAAPAASGGGVVFPPFGRSKGQPIMGASLQDLQFYANACRRSLADESKARFHEKERALLGAIELEIARAYGKQQQQEEPPIPDAPPPDLPF